MYLVKNLLTILILFYAYSAIAMSCPKAFKPEDVSRKGTVNGDTLKQDSSNSGTNKNTVPSVETKLEVQQEKGVETIGYSLDLVRREWDLIWDSLFSKDNIRIGDIPQLAREKQIELMYKIVSQPEYSYFDVRDRKKWLRVLFAEGVDVNTQNSQGESLLHTAVQMNGDVGRRLVKFLLKSGADVQVENHAGQTPLQIAYARNNQEIIEILQNQM